MKEFAVRNVGAPSLVSVRLALAAAVLALAACAPAHDWRQVRSADGALAALMPCRPQLHERRVDLAGQSLKLSLLACDAGGQTWGIASADVGDPLRIGSALEALAAAAAANAGTTAQGASSPAAATAATAASLVVPGAMVHAAARRLSVAGRRPDGRPLQLHTAVFAHGTHVYQATVLGDALPADAGETFFGALRVGP